MKHCLPRMRAVVFFLLIAVATGAAAENAGDSDARELRRIEAAFSAGLGRAATPLETFECLRFRNVELAGLLERTYAATLSWLTDRPEIADALEKDQIRWLSELIEVESIWGRSMGDLIVAQAAVSTMLLERLRLLKAIAVDGILINTPILR